MTVKPYLGCLFTDSRFDYINRYEGEEIMSKKHSKMSLPVQMVIGLILGVIVGSMTSAEFTAAYLRPFGQLFITLIRMVVVPLVLATIIAGAAGIHDLTQSWGDGRHQKRSSTTSSPRVLPWASGSSSPISCSPALGWIFPRKA